MNVAVGGNVGVIEGVDVNEGNAKRVNVTLGVIEAVGVSVLVEVGIGVKVGEGVEVRVGVGVGGGGKI